MKNPIKQMGVMLTAALVMAACAVAQAQQANPYFTGGGGKGIRLAVLEPAGKGLSEDDKWMLSLVQSSIYTDFNKYSGMTLIDKQNIEKVLEEWEQSMSGNYSDADRVKIGNLTNASHILSGTVIKTPNAFMLELSVTDLQSGERKASYSHPTSTAAIENHSAIKEASAELLKQLGVNLTSTALGELKQATNIARIQAEEALARGIVAKRQGTEVAALSYFFQAAILDPSLAEAVNRSSVMAANVSSGNIGEDARNDVAWRKSWVKRLEEAEQYIDHLNKTVSMPYTLFYSDEIIRGDINYQKETMPITIKTNLYGNGSIKVWAQSVEKALGAVYDGLEATGRKDVWNFRWPYNNVTNLGAFNRQEKKFTIVAELVNSKNNVIGKREFKVSGRWSYDTYNGRPKVNVDSDTREDVTFRDVNVNDITDNLTIRFASVNSEDAKIAAQKGVLQIKAMPKSTFDANDLFTFAFGEIKKYRGTSEKISINIPHKIWDDPVISIGEGVYSNKSLIRVMIPNGVTSIGKQAFGWNKLTSVTIPNSVTSIGESAFYSNELTSITIGENVALDENAFGNGFEEAYPNSGRSAGTYNSVKTDNSGEWVRQATEAELHRQERIRQEKYANANHKELIQQIRIELKKKRYDLVFKMINEAFAEKQYDLVIDMCNNTIEVDKELGNAYYMRGKAYAFKKEYDNAIADFSKYIQLFPKFSKVHAAEAYIWRGNAYNEKREYKKAIADFNNVLRLGYLGGNANTLEYATQESKTLINNLIADTNNNLRLFKDEAYIGRGNAYNEKREYKKAISDFNTVLQISKDNEKIEKAKAGLERAQKGIGK